MKRLLKIVNTLGLSAVDQILRDEQALDQVPGLNEEMKNRLREDLRTNQGFEQVALELAKYGIGLQLAQKIYQAFEEETIKQLMIIHMHLCLKLRVLGFKGPMKWLKN
ncbi:helix-hairpin-helix domain-containing protein [Piscibacillus salipiscarius]|uniref:helix-hairpin-helix domain-containing protein n=1 Tax=Piscibacillus salipiscarius TaxID=299480 RepID=UPI002436932A|nr:helix-hairpin-helix domain-containing protein [Piscibacillus salipiscarius]